MRLAGKIFFLVLFLAGVVFAAGDYAGKKCYECGREITDLKLAGRQGGKFFDEPGCMIKHRSEDLCAMEQMEFDEKAVAVDYQSGEEVPFSKMFFLKNPAIKTPNGYGVAAYKEEQAGRAAGGVVINFVEMSRMRVEEILN